MKTASTRPVGDRSVPNLAAPGLVPGSLTARTIHQLWTGSRPVRLSAEQRADNPGIVAAAIGHLVVRGHFDFDAEGESDDQLLRTVGVDVMRASSHSLRNATRNGGGPFRIYLVTGHGPRGRTLEVRHELNDVVLMRSYVDNSDSQPDVPLDVILAAMSEPASRPHSSRA